MDIFKRLRNANIVFSASVFMFFFSCTQYEMSKRVFDDNIYNEFKNGNIDLFVNDSNTSERSIQNSQRLIAKVNDHYGTDIKIPDELFQAFIDEDEAALIKNGWLTQTDINLSAELIKNINSAGFDSAIETYKNQILSLNLTNEEFAKKNTVVNLLKITNEENPNLLKTDYSQRMDGWSCAGAWLYFLLSFASVIACVTVILCAFALYTMFDSVDYLVEQCN